MRNYKPVRTSGFAKVLDEIGIITWRNLAHIPRVPEKLADVTIQPIVFVLLFGYVFGSAINLQGGNYIEFLLAGIFVQSAAFGAINNAVGVVGDMKEGVIDRFRSLPIARISVLLGRAIASLLESALGICVMVICGLAIGWHAHGGFMDTAGAFGLLAFFTFAMICIGTMLGLWVKTAEAAQGIGFVVVFPLTFAANTFVPTMGMPAPLRFVADHSPVSATVAALRHLFGNPNPVAPDAPWNLTHPVEATLLWCTGLALAGLAGAVYRYTVARKS
ncbi:MAG TPA: ABC transporter permease [Candidatus Kapabacteria bacterium]|nr:ABC transporter permease [Candidatus Kapabacteria bacterium]